MEDNTFQATGLTSVEYNQIIAKLDAKIKTLKSKLTKTELAKLEQRSQPKKAYVDEDRYDEKNEINEVYFQYNPCFHNSFFNP